MGGDYAGMCVRKWGLARAGLQPLSGTEEGRGTEADPGGQ